MNPEHYLMKDRRPLAEFFWQEQLVAFALEHSLQKLKT
jgi:hypothetical protein